MRKPVLSSRGVTRGFLVLALGGSWAFACPMAPARVPANRSDGGQAATAHEPREISEAIEEIRARHDLPSLAVIGYEGGKRRVQGVCGVRMVGDPTRATIDDAYAVGSCGKAMTATMIATLVEEGIVSWETTISEAIPDLEDEIDPGFAKVTLLDLLQHQGGIAERKNPELARLLGDQFAHLEGSGTEQRWQAVAEVLSRPPTTPPRGGMEYSNYGYMTAAAMAEEVTGESWRELMKTRLFEPLGMKTAGFGLPGTVGVLDQPRSHRKTAKGWESLEPKRENDLPECIAPAGLIYCNLADWARFVQAHLDGERGRDGIVTAATFKRLHRPPEGSEYACGWGVTKRPWAPGPIYTHNGSNGAWFSVVWASPERNLLALAITNGAAPDTPAALDEAIVATFRAMGILPPAVETTEEKSENKPDAKGGDDGGKRGGNKGGDDGADRDGALAVARGV